MFCKHCGKEIAQDSEFCQFCGAKQNNNSDSNKYVAENEVNNKDTIENAKPQQNKPLLGCVYAIVSIILIIFLVAVFSENDSNNYSSTTDVSTVSEESKPDLEVIEHHSCSTEYGVKAVCGTVQNNTDENYSYAQISVNFYNSNGDLMESSLDNINNLGSGQKWKFKVPMLSEANVSKYEIMNVEGW